MKVFYGAWGGVGFIYSLVNLGWMLIWPGKSVADLLYVAAGELIWIGVLLFFGIALIVNALAGGTDVRITE